MWSKRPLLVLLYAVAAALLITIVVDYLWLKPLSTRWTTHRQVECVVTASIVAAVIGALIGYRVSRLAVVRTRRWELWLIVMPVLTFASAILAGSAAYLTVGSWWPSEMIYGIDADVLISYVLVAGGVATLVFALAPNIVGVVNKREEGNA